MSPTDYPFHPAWPTFRYLSRRGWWVKTQELLGGGFIFQYPLKAGKSVQVELDESLVGNIRKGTLLRLENRDLHSEPFRW